MSNTNKRAVWLVVAIAIYFIITMLPAPLGMTPEGQKAVGLVIAAVLCWAFTPIPIAISSLAFVFMLPLVKIETMPGALANFANATVFFVIASFLLAIALAESGLSKRISLKLAIISKGNTTKAIFLLFCAAAAVSTVISDPPVVAAFTPIALDLINRAGVEKGKSNFAKALLIGVSVAALLGGVGTPAGSSINVLALSLLESEAGIKVSFIQWVSIGLPFVIICAPLMAKAITMVFPSEVKSISVEDVAKEYKALGGLTVKEKKFIIIMVLMVAVWLTDTIHKLPIPLTTTLGAALFFVPGIDLLTWDNAKGKIGWDTILMIGACSALGTALSKTGAALCIAEASLSGIRNSGTLVALTVVVIFTIVVHLIIPVSPAIVSVMAPTLVAFAATMPGNPAALLVVPMGFSASAAYMLPLDPCGLITYGHGYYSMGDFMKAGVVVSVIWTVFMVAAMLLIGAPMGLI